MRSLRGVLVLLMTTSAAFAGGDWKNSPLHQWFEGLSSKIGLCCSNADGLTLTDVQWDMKDGHYRVFLDGQWIVVPDEAIVVEPNRYGQAVVWPYSHIVLNGDQEKTVITIRCFMPGIEA
jgi:hypothetical protein